MPITTYLNFDGTCKEALLFYQDVFQTKEPEFMTFSEMPGGEDLSDEMKSLILHAEIHILNTKIYASDSPNDEERPFQPGNHAILTIEVTSEKEARLYYERLKEGGKVQTALGPTFFSPLFAELEDRFGMQWMIMVA